jgi:serine/threonine protein kinase
LVFIVYWLALDISYLILDVDFNRNVLTSSLSWVIFVAPIFVMMTTFRKETLFWRGHFQGQAKRKPTLPALEYSSGLRDALYIPDHCASDFMERVDALCVPLIDFSLVLVERLIGTGTTASVYSGIFQSRPVALKRLLLPPDDLTEADVLAYCSYVSLHARLSHPRIEKLMGLVISPPHLCLVSHLYERGSLEQNLDLIKTWSWPKLLRLMSDLFFAIEYLHAHSPPIAHRDIKPANLLLSTDWTLGLSDFGSACVLPNKRRLSDDGAPWGSPLWLSPEVVANLDYDASIDVYSAAITIWQMATGLRNFSNCDSLDDFQKAVAQGARPSLAALTIASRGAPPQGFHELLESCWHREPSLRPFAGEAARRLEALLLQYPFTHSSEARHSSFSDRFSDKISLKSEHGYKQRESEVEVEPFVGIDSENGVDQVPHD